MVTRGADHLRADAIRHGADAEEVDLAINALRKPDREVCTAAIDLGDWSVAISHPGRGHTDHDLIAVCRGDDRTVVFCGDLVRSPVTPASTRTPIWRHGRQHWITRWPRAARKPRMCRVTAPSLTRISYADNVIGWSIRSVSVGPPVAATAGAATASRGAVASGRARLATAATWRGPDGSPRTPSARLRAR